jgi:hypothetical protein
MTVLMRNLAGDLVDRRLWPFAAALLAAIAAVPLLLMSGSASRNTSESTPAPAKPAPAAHAAQVHLDTAAPSNTVVRTSKARNPFTSRSMPKDATATASSPPAATPAPAISTPAATSSPAQSVAKSSPEATVNPPAAQAPAAAPHGAATARATAIKYRVAWRFGIEGSPQGNHDVARLTALPSPHAPALIFLGLLKRPGGMAAMFLVEPGAQAQGDGRCLPDASACHILKLRAHQSEVVTFGQVRYRLDMAHIQRGHATPAAAKRLRTRESHAGRKALRAAIDAGVRGVGEFVFNRKKGLLAPYVPGAQG